MILDRFTESKKPLDLLLSDYFRAHKSIGAHDRRTIGQTLYSMVRFKTLIDYFCPSSKSPQKLECFQKISIDACAKDTSIPEQIRIGLNDFLYKRFTEVFGSEKTKELASVLNNPAPITVRANTLKISRDELIQKWKGKFDVVSCKKAPNGIQFSKREALFSLPEFKDGHFEMQDEGSQIVSELVKVKPGKHFLDFCSGSGGKTLAIAPAMKGKGQIYLNDIRPWVLLEAKKRLKRAGIQNVQYVLPKKKVDWLLLDVPCSGTGTLRRNPDAKWKIDQAMVERLVQEQRAIMQEAIPHLKNGGKLVYVTCSLLPEENEAQVAHLLENYPLELEGEPQSLLPEEGGTDGFFAAVFKKQNLV